MFTSADYLRPIHGTEKIYPSISDAWRRCRPDSNVGDATGHFLTEHLVGRNTNTNARFKRISQQLAVLAM